MASSFLFQTTKSIWCELGAAKHLGRVLSEELMLKSAKGGSVVVCTDRGITSKGLELQAFENLAEHGYDVVMFDGVKADPHEDIVLEAVDLARSVDARCVVGFGGGSSMDVAKLVAFLAHPQARQHLRDVYGVGACFGERLPLVQVPTTAGTGSEVTPISIVTTGAQEKKGVVSPLLLPDFAVLDGELTAGLPRDVTAATGIDAIVHAVEAFTSRHKKNPVSDMLAREALRLLGGNIRQVCSDGEDLRARGEMLLGSMYAGQAFANAPVAAVHALAYPIGSHFKVPHGLSNALLLPHVLRFNAEDAAAAKLYAGLRPVLFPGTQEGRGSLADDLATLSEELEVPRTLRDVGVTESDLEMLAKEAMKQTRLLPNNPREVTESDARRLYEQAL